MDGGTRAPVLEQVRLPDLQLLAARARAAPVLVQLAGRRLPDLRRPRPGDGVRPRARRRLSVAEPGQRRGEGLGPAQRLHLLAARKRRRGTTASTSTRRSRSCPRRAQQVLLHGSGSDEIEFVYEAEGARGKHAQRQALASVRRHPAELRAALPRDRFGRGARGPGALPERQALPRLRRHAAAARGAPRLPASTPASGEREPIFRVEHFTLRECLAYFETLQLHGAKAEIADKVVREIRSRLKFLNDVGPELPEPGPQRRHAVGRRGAAHPARVADRLGPDRRDVRARRAVASACTSATTSA